ncbi:hypothetical protein [Spirosoma sp. 209]|uniref:hypothetical protein n=1 Tax=Spirosoma sp. 209 TaxID=1955701 RepID=UPI00098CFF18|nr:hypothetical protein [Spirosoma sp. 209]
MNKIQLLVLLIVSICCFVRCKSASDKEKISDQPPVFKEDKEPDEEVMSVLKGTMWALTQIKPLDEKRTVRQDSNVFYMQEQIGLPAIHFSKDGDFRLGSISGPYTVAEDDNTGDNYILVYDKGFFSGTTKVQEFKIIDISDDKLSVLTTIGRAIPDTVYPGAMTQNFTIGIKNLRIDLMKVTNTPF